MRRNPRFLLIAFLLLLSTLACRTMLGGTELSQPQGEPSDAVQGERSTPTPLPANPVQPGASSPDEPVFITGDIPYTSPFFINLLAEPFVLLEDQAGFVRRDREFEFLLSSQTVGPVEMDSDGRLTYSLALPTIPQGTLVDVDNDGDQDTGLQVFAVAFWSNTWGGPFLEERDGEGWSTASASTITDPEQDDEIIGGTLVIWSPDDEQAFPSGFGEDGKLFTDDDPTAPVPAGYNLVDLDEEPFQVTKQARPEITLPEGESAVNDYSQMSYSEAFEALFAKVSREYPFTEEKSIDWQQLHEQFAPRVAEANDDISFYRVMRDFTWSIPDQHIGLSFNPQVFFEERAGGVGLVLSELSDGRVIVTQVIPGKPGEAAGIQPAAEIVTWNGLPVSEAIGQVVPYLGPYSTQHALRMGQVVFLTRGPIDSEITVTFKNPGTAEPQEATLQAVEDYESFFASLPELQEDELALPIESQVLDQSGLGYVRLTTFSDDYNLLARLWERTLQGLIDNEVPGLIIDIRNNGGGSGGLATDFAGYFFEQEIVLSRGAYYNENTGKFEYEVLEAKLEPAPFQYEGAIAVLVGPNCVSACEGFANALKQEGRSIIVGHSPTAGAFGEVGRGQYKLPGDIDMQFPTGRPETPEGELLIEGAGVTPDVVVPVTEASALGSEDAVLNAAVQALQEKIKQP